MAAMKYAVVEGSGYHDQVYVVVDRKAIVQDAIRHLKPIHADYDTIAVRGVSGLTVGSILAHMLQKHLIIVRKDGESSHGKPVEGVVNSRYIIVDDFEVSGNTVNVINEGAAKLRGTWVATYMWRDRELTTVTGKVKK